MSQISFGALLLGVSSEFIMYFIQLNSTNKILCKALGMHNVTMELVVQWNSAKLTIMTDEWFNELTNIQQCLLHARHFLDPGHTAWTKQLFCIYKKKKKMNHLKSIDFIFID